MTDSTAENLEAFIQHLDPRTIALRVTDLRAIEPGCVRVSFVDSGRAYSLLLPFPEAEELTPLEPFFPTIAANIVEARDTA